MSDIANEEEVILEQTLRLAERLADSCILAEYNAAKEELSASPLIKALVEEYKSRNFHFQFVKMSDGNTDDASADMNEERKLSELLSVINADAAGRNFLSAEGKALRLIAKVYDTIGQACKIDLGI